MMNLNSPEQINDPRQIAFVDYLATPKYLRGLTHKEFAKTIKVTPQTLSEWKKLDGFMDAVTYQVNMHSRTHTSEIVDALAKKAKGGDVAAIRLWLEYVEGWTKKTHHLLQSQNVSYAVQWES